MNRRTAERVALTFAFFMSACGSSSSSGGTNSYAHCAAASVLSDSTVMVGRTRLTIDEGVLTVGGTSGPVQVAAFGGPGLDATGFAEALARVASDAPTLVFMLGGLGDDVASAKHNIAALAAVRVPVLFVAGGRDEEGVLEEAFDSLSDELAERILDATRLRKIVIAGATFIPIGGAPNGRYARSENACGFAQSDLDKLDDVLGRVGDEHRYLLSWAAPTSPSSRSASTGLASADAGDPMLARFAARIGANGGLFAWPVESARLPMPHDSARILSRAEASTGFRMVVPSLSAIGTQRGDGSRLSPAFALIEIGPQGLSFMGP